MRKMAKMTKLGLALLMAGTLFLTGCGGEGDGGSKGSESQSGTSMGSSESSKPSDDSQAKDTGSAEDSGSSENGATADDNEPTGIVPGEEPCSYVYKFGMNIDEEKPGYITLAATWDAEISKEGDVFTIYFPKAWNQIFWKIPQEILDAGITAAEVDYADDNRVWLGFTKDDENFIGVCHANSADYIDTTWNLEQDMTEDDIKDIRIFKFMDGNDDYTIKVRSVTFFTENEVPLN